MRKNIFLLIMVLVTVLQCSCQLKSINNIEETDKHYLETTQKNNKEEIEELSKTETTPSFEEETTEVVLDKEIAEKIKFETSIVGGYETFSVFNKSTAYEFDTVEYTDENATQTISKEILGVTYTFNYSGSAILPRSDMNVHVYKTQEENPIVIFIKTDTGEIVEYNNVPYEGKFNSEEEYVAFLRSFIGTRADLDSFDYKCSTHHYTTTKNGFSSSLAEGFQLPYETAEEKREINSYFFFYSKRLNGVILPEFISAEIETGGRLYIEIYDFNVQYAQIASTIECVPYLNSKIEEYLRENAKEGYMISDIIFECRSLFVKNGICYILDDIIIEYSDLNGEAALVIPFQTISRLLEN